MGTRVIPTHPTTDTPEFYLNLGLILTVAGSVHPLREEDTPVTTLHLIHLEVTLAISPKKEEG